MTPVALDSMPHLDHFSVDLKHRVSYLSPGSYLLLFIVHTKHFLLICINRVDFHWYWPPDGDPGYSILFRVYESLSCERFF